MDINEVIIKGKLQYNPERRVSKDGKTVFTNVVISTFKLLGKDKGGTSYVPVVAFGETAERICQGSKGDSILVLGYVTSGYYNKNGVNVSNSQVTAITACLTNEPNHYLGSAPGKEMESEKDVPDVVDDLPY